MSEPSRPISTDEQGFYRVEQDDYCVCNTCHQDTANWTIVSGTGEETCGIGQSWGHKETADDICDLMNMAYDAGQESRQETITSLCDRLDKINNLTRPRPAKDPYKMLRDIEEWSSGFMKVPT